MVKTLQKVIESELIEGGKIKRLERKTTIHQKKINLKKIII